MRPGAPQTPQQVPEPREAEFSLPAPTVGAGSTPGSAFLSRGGWAHGLRQGVSRGHGVHVRDRLAVQ